MARICCRTWTAAAFPPDGKWKDSDDAKPELDRNLLRITALQRKLYADRRHSLLVVLQGIVMFLQLAVGGHLLLFVVRTKRSVFEPPYPSARLFWAILATQIVDLTKRLKVAPGSQVKLARIGVSPHHRRARSRHGAPALKPR